MKTNAIIRIILYCLASILLVAALCGTLISCNISIDGSGAPDNLGNGSVSATQVDRLCVEWVSGTVKIQPGDTKDILFSESSSSSKAKQMHWKQNGDTLTIQFERAFNGIHIGPSISYDKDLTITVPKDWSFQDIEIESVSTDLFIQEVSGEEISIETVSGRSNIEKCTAGSISMETVSGDADISADFAQLNIDAVSANCRVYSLGKPRNIELNGVSGDLDLYMVQEVGFTYSSDSLTCHFSSDFSTTNSGDRRIYGDGSCLIEVECVSGSINIRKPQ